VNDGGGYLTITQDLDNPDTQNAFVQSAGTLNLLGTDGANLGSATGVVGMVGELIYITTLPTGDIQILADDTLVVGSNTGDTTIASAEANVNIETAVGSIIINSADQITCGGVNDVAIGSTAGNVAITSDAGSINLTSATETVITATDYISVQAQEAMELISNANTITITAATGIEMTATSNDINLTTTAGSTNITSGSEISLEATGGNIRIHSTTGDLILQGETSISLNAGTSLNVNFNSNNLTNVGTINGYNPPLRIYKNATIGSAISRAANTAEVQVYQQTMTLKANTQYLLNMSYAGLTENVATATPNNNWYIIYRVHQGSSPLTTANLWGLAQLFNSTSQAGGVSVSFMTTTAGTYTGRFYIRNTNLTVALTVANIQASVIEVV
jgi:hypothetical protein